MSSIRFEQGDVSIDAAVIAEGLAIEPAQVQPLMRDGRITSLCERGVDEDAGRYRLTFFHGKRRFRLVADAQGNVIEHSAATTGDGPRRAVRRGGGPSRQSRGKPE
jgi:hypothetical protein